MTQLTADRYVEVCRAFVKLADKFQKLDVEHMTLKCKVVQILKLLKSYKELSEKLSQEKQELEQKLHTVTLKYEDLKVFEFLLEPEFQALFKEVEEQLELVDETLKEMEEDRDPDLDDLDKELLVEYQNQPDRFSELLASHPEEHSVVA
jgi:chromosome segregation ATPase